MLEIIIALLTLTVLEIVLGVDNLVFLSIVSNRLPEKKQKLARRFGLSLALFARLLLLLFILEIAQLTNPLFTLSHHTFSFRDLFLIAGGLFLLFKGTDEIHAEFEPDEEKISRNKISFLNALTQIVALDVIFSLDSIITAVGLTQIFWIMATAITIAIILMLIASEPLSKFIHRYPTARMLAFSFLLLIGTVLIADGFQFHVPREYVYFALSFSIFVEFLNTLRSKRRKKKTKGV